MTWVEGATVAIGLSTVGIGIYTYRATNKASEQAGSAVLQAKDANSIATKANSLAQESNRIASSASEFAKAAPTDLAWDEMVVAIAAIASLNPASGDQDLAPFLTAIRTRATLLVDRVGWARFGDWVAWETQLGIHLMRAAMVDGSRSKPLLLQEVMDINQNFHAWSAAFTQNLRHFRKNGLDASALTELTSHAQDQTAAVTTRHGWPMPTPTMPGVSPLRP